MQVYACVMCVCIYICFGMSVLSQPKYVHQHPSPTTSLLLISCLTNSTRNPLNLSQTHGVWMYVYMISVVFYLQTCVEAIAP